jgi:hypothetical protein
MIYLNLGCDSYVNGVTYDDPNRLRNFVECTTLKTRYASVKGFNMKSTRGSGNNLSNRSNQKRKVSSL